MKKDELNKINEKLEEISFKLGSMDISKALELGKLYIGKDVVIQVNYLIPHFERVTKFLKHCSIPFSVFNVPKKVPKRFDIHFGKSVEFMDLYIISAILKNFGLQSVFFSKKASDVIFIGSYMTECTNKKKESVGIKVDELIKLPFYTTNVDLLASKFSNDPDYLKISKSYLSEAKEEYIDDQEESEDLYPEYYEEDDPYHKHWDDFELSSGDWDYDPLNEAHDPGNNPWIEVFGPGEEAETAYWNTD